MNRLGWYVGDKLYKNKWVALENHKLKDINFYFYEDIFDCYDWSKPIETSYNNLLHIRAKQLR